MKKELKYFWVVLLGLVMGCTRGDKLYYAAPSLLPDTRREMKTAGFWIDRHPFADKLVMGAEDIRSFNAMIRDDLKLTQDITQVAETIDGDTLRADLRKIFESFSGQGFYDGRGNRAPKSFFLPLAGNMAVDKIPARVNTQFGLVVHYADQRLLPTDEGLYQKRGDVDFDELQNSALDVGTPVAILTETLDGIWYYVQSPLTSGWVKVQKIARCALSELKEFLSNPSFVVVTDSKADIFLDEKLTQYYEYARMGARLPMNNKVIIVPTRDDNGRLTLKPGYMNTDEIHEGYLPYTPRTMIRQAFKMLNAPYGWGGMYGEQDCSRFLQEIFAVVGISLPRNSSAQGKVGQLIAQFNDQTSDVDRIDVLQKRAAGGITVLYLKGHILLYLGVVDGRPYAIHSVWAYRQPGAGVDIPRVINRTAVSDLFLGKGSRSGSLLERLKVIREMAK